jgi:hypothetical protein
MNHARLLDLEVDIVTMRRRIDALEARLTGSVQDLNGPQPLFDLYAHLVLDGLEPTPDSAALMRTCVMLMTPRTLLDLARLTGDMFSWRPFLAGLDLLHLRGYDVTEATEWLEGSVQDLLRAQGLGMLRPEDVLRSPTGPIAVLKRIALSGR